MGFWGEYSGWAHSTSYIASGGTGWTDKFVSANWSHSPGNLEGRNELEITFLRHLLCFQTSKMVKTWGLSAAMSQCPSPYSSMWRSSGRCGFHFLAQLVASEVLAPLLGQCCVLWIILGGFSFRASTCISHNETTPLLSRRPRTLPFLEQGTLLWLVTCHASPAFTTAGTSTQTWSIL